MKVKNVDKYIYKNEYGEEEADMCTAIRELIEDGRAEGRAEGRSEGRAEGILSSRLESITNLMDSMKITLIDAMDALRIPEGDRDEIKKHLMQS